MLRVARYGHAKRSESWPQSPERYHVNHVSLSSFIPRGITGSCPPGGTPESESLADPPRFIEHVVLPVKPPAGATLVCTPTVFICMWKMSVHAEHASPS